MARELTLKDQRYPPLIRAANCVLTAAGAVGFNVSSLGAEELMEAASRKAGGLDDFGHPGFQDGMRRVLDNVDELGFTPMSRQITRATYMKGLDNRLQLQAFRKAHPEVDDVEIHRPIFVLGFPRTGTTLIQYLLAMNEQRRALKFWELLTPVPVYADRAKDIRKRRRDADIAMKVAYAVAPEMGVVHHIQTDTFEECWYVFCNSFRVLNWDLQTGLRSYGKWLLEEADMVQAYREYKSYLQVLQLQDPKARMVVKCPEHLWFVDALLEVFPDACIVWTHRDPASAVTSYCTLMALTRRMIYGKFDPQQMGPYVTDRFVEAVTRAMDARDRWGNEATFMDVDFLDLLHDRAGVMRRLCERFDLPWDDADIGAYERVRVAEGRIDEPGAHHYSAQQMNVQSDRLHSVFRPYLERFDIPVKDA